MISVSELFKSLTSLIFPDRCLCCEKIVENAEILCDECLCALPRTEMHKHKFNSAEQRLGDAKIIGSASYCWYKHESDFRKMIHLAKYANRPEIMSRLAEQAIAEWSESNFFADIDLVIPVPMHKDKMRERGYNQSEYIAAALASKLNLTLCTDALVRIRNDKSQTAQVAPQDRLRNVVGSFALIKKESVAKKRVLLVDDVLTTGATISECIKQLHKAYGVQIKVFTLGITI